MINTLNLSHPQKRIWLTEIMHPDLELSNIGLLIKISNLRFNSNLLQKAINYTCKSDDGTRSLSENVITGRIKDKGFR